MIKAGNYTAKLVAYGVPAVEGDKSPHIAFTFEYKDGADTNRIQTRRYLTAAAIDYTAKDLVTLGLKQDSVESLSHPNAFEDKEVSINIGRKKNKDGTLSEYMDVLWINHLNKFTAMDPSQVKRNFSQFNSAISIARAESGVKKTSLAPKAVSNSDFAPAEDFDLGN